MLNILFGNCSADNYIDNPDLFFNNTYLDEWLDDEISKQIVADIDNSELVSANLVVSPVLGSISIDRLSGGAKTLILIAHDAEHIYNASACGDNCASWLAKIGSTKDILVRMGHIMHFDEECFPIRIVNTEEIINNQKELVFKIIENDLLAE